MISSACPSCYSSLRARLRQKILTLQQLRRNHHVSDKDIARSFDNVLFQYPDAFATQLIKAREFFATYKAFPFWTGSEWRKLPESKVPEIAFIGRSNVGKSSVINRIVGHEVCRFGPRPGVTTAIRAYTITGRKPDGGAGKGGEMDDKMALLDTPGYGYGSNEDMGKDILKYLRSRKQLRKVFFCIDISTIKTMDRKMMDLLREMEIPYQTILTKADKILGGLDKKSSTEEEMLAKLKGAIMKAHHDLRESSNSATWLPVSQFSAENLAISGRFNSWKNHRVADEFLDGLRWSILAATGHASTPSESTPDNASKLLKNVISSILNVNDSTHPRSNETTSASIHRSAETPQSEKDSNMAIESPMSKARESSKSQRPQKPQRPQKSEESLTDLIAKLQRDFQSPAAQQPSPASQPPTGPDSEIQAVSAVDAFLSSEVEAPSRRKAQPENALSNDQSSGTLEDPKQADDTASPKQVAEKANTVLQAPNDGDDSNSPLSMENRKATRQYLRSLPYHRIGDSSLKSTPVTSAPGPVKRVGGMAELEAMTMSRNTTTSKKPRTRRRKLGFVKVKLHNDSK